MPPINMNIQYIATVLGIKTASVRMKCSRNNIRIVDCEIEDIVGADMINKHTKVCPQCLNTHTRIRFCSDVCRTRYGNIGKSIRSKFHPLNSVKISGIKGEDRRIRFSNEDREDVRYKHKCGASINSLAKEYCVNKRAIQFIIFPERYEHAKLLAKKRRDDGRYKRSKEDVRISMADHRKHKRSLLINKGILAPR